MSHTLQIHWQSYGWLQCKFDLCSVTEVNVAHRHLQVCLFVLDILSPGAKLTSSFYHLEARSSVSAGLERTSLCEWIHVIPDKHHPHPTPPLLPSPLEGWTCVSWCRSSSVPADYSMSYDSMGTAAVGIRQAAGPHLQPPPSSTGPPSSALLVRDWSQPLYQGWVILELGLSLTTSPLFTLSISWRLEWMFHCCTRVIATCYQEGNTVFITLICFKVFKPCCMTVCVNIRVPATLFGIQNCSTLEVTPRMAVSDGQTFVLVMRGVWRFWQKFNNMRGTWRVYRD